MNKSKTRNRNLKWSSRENILAMKCAKSLCNNLIKTNKKSYFQKVREKGFANNKAYWNTIKPFLTNKGFLTSDSISLTKENETITDKKTITHSFNTHYVNIVKNHQVKPLRYNEIQTTKPLICLLLSLQLKSMKTIVVQLT